MKNLLLAVIAKGHVLSPDGLIRCRSFYSPSIFFLFRIQRLNYTLSGSLGFLELSEESSQLRHGHHDLNKVEDKCNQFSGSEYTTGYLHPPVTDNYNQQHHENKRDYGPNPGANLPFSNAEPEETCNAFFPVHIFSAFSIRSLH
ncbi:hypothetical protein D3C72_1639670 [compost metagenome]